MRRADLLCAGIFVCVGLATLLWLIPSYVAQSVRPDELSPAFMPYVAALLMTGAMLGLFVLRLSSAGHSGEKAPLSKGSGLFIGSAALVLGTAFVLMELFGYLLGAAAVVAGFMLLARARLRVVLGTAVALPLALWLLFDKLLGFPLP